MDVFVLSLSLSLNFSLFFLVFLQVAHTHFGRRGGVGPRTLLWLAFKLNAQLCHAYPLLPPFQGRLLRVLKLAKCVALTGVAFERLLTAEAAVNAVPPRAVDANGARAPSRFFFRNQGDQAQRLYEKMKKKNRFVRKQST